MINIITLKEELYDLMKTECDVYEQGRVPSDASFPYATFFLETSTEGLTDNTEQVVFNLNVTVLDHSKTRNTTVIEGLTNDLVAKLHKAFVQGDTYYFNILRQSILTGLPVSDEYMMRREINCTVNTYSQEI